MVRPPGIAIVVAVTVALSACGGGDDDALSDDTPAATAGESAESDDGPSDAESGEFDRAPADLGDFPIPAPPGSVVTFTNELEDVTAILVAVPIADFEAAIAFYDDWTSSQPGQYQRVVAEAGGVVWTLTSGPSDAARSIIVSAPTEGDTEVMISLTDDPPG